MLNGQRRPNHQTFFLHTPTRSGSTRGRAVSLIAMLFLSAYLGGYRSRLCLVRPLQTEKRHVRVDPNITMECTGSRFLYARPMKSHYPPWHPSPVQALNHETRPESMPDGKGPLQTRGGLSEHVSRRKSVGVQAAVSGEYRQVGSRTKLHRDNRTILPGGISSTGRALCWSQRGRRHFFNVYVD